MTTRLAPLPAPEELTPARSAPRPRGAHAGSLRSGRALAGDLTTRLAPLPASEELTPARSGAAERSPAI